MDAACAGHMPQELVWEASGTILQPTPAAPPAGGVCIVRQGLAWSVDAALLQQHGLKLRPSASCAPDVIITAPGLAAPLAVIAAHSLQPGDSLEDGAFMQRCASMASTFRCCFLLVPWQLGGHACLMEVAHGSRYKGKLNLHHFSPPDGITNVMLQLASSLQQAPAAAGSGMTHQPFGAPALTMMGDLHQERLVAAQSPEVLHHMLAAIAAADELASVDEMAALVGVFGSLQQLAAASADDIAACTGWPPERAARLYAFWNSCPGEQ